MFERFTDRARTVLREAQAEAAMLNHDFVGTEHLLLGLLADNDSVAGRVLVAQGVTRDAARAAIVRTIGPCETTGAVGAATAAGGENHRGRARPDTTDAGAAPDALATIGIDLDAVRSAVEASFGRGALERAAVGRGRRRAVPFTPRTKKVLELSLRQALALGHNYIGTEHLLLALVSLGEGVAYEVLDELAPPASRLRQGVLDELDQRMRPGA